MSDELPISGPLGLGDLLDRAFRLCRVRLWTLILIAAVLLVPLGVLTGVTTGRVITGFTDMMQEFATEPPDAVFFDQLLLGYGLIGLLLLLGYLVNGLVTLALAHQSIAVLHNQQPSLWESIRAGLSRFLTFLVMSIVKWALILIMTAILGGLLMLLLSMFVFGSAFLTGVAGPDDPLALAVSLLFGLMLCVGYPLVILFMLLPTLYFSARWIAAMPGLIAQRWGPVESLRRSWGLTKGHVWRSVGYVILLWLLGGLITTLPLLVIEFGLFLLPPRLIGLAIGVIAGLGSVLGVLWQPINVAAIVLLYYDLRVRKEGYDLALRVDQLEAQVQLATGGMDG